MKHFRISNNDLNNWIERKFYHAIEVVEFIEKKNMDTFEVEWKTPVTGEYATLLVVENGKRVYTNDNFNLPTVFKKLGK